MKGDKALSPKAAASRPLAILATGNPGIEK